MLKLQHTYNIHIINRRGVELSCGLKNMILDYQGHTKEPKKWVCVFNSDLPLANKMKLAMEK